MRKLLLIILTWVGMGIVPAAAQAAVISSWSLASNANDSADDNDGTATNVTFTGSAAVFNGTSAKISVPYNANLSPGSSNITAGVSINTTFEPGTGDFDFDLVRSAKGNPQYKIELFPHSGKSQAQCIFYGSRNKITLPGGPSLSDGVWHTIVCKKTSNKVTLMVDGTAVAAKSITIGSITHKSGTPFSIGYKPTSTGGADFYHGSMKNVSVAIG
jgi:concanavalin A-like lectin/glucanase superfamily protein